MTKPTADQLKGLHGTCATVRVRTRDGFAIVNAHEYDPAVHGELYDEPAAETPDESKPKRAKR